MTNEFKMDFAVRAIEITWEKAQECKADGNENGYCLWLEEAYGMLRMFQILTTKKAVIRDNKVVIVEQEK